MTSSAMSLAEGPVVGALAGGGAAGVEEAGGLELGAGAEDGGADSAFTRLISHHHSRNQAGALRARPSGLLILGQSFECAGGPRCHAGRNASNEIQGTIKFQAACAPLRAGDSTPFHQPSPPVWL